jgi:hypothetical protein
MSETTTSAKAAAGTRGTKRTVKRTAAKKSPAKKPVTRKATAKKPPTKKTTTAKKTATAKPTTTKPTTAKSSAPTGFAAAAVTAMGVLQSRLPFELPTIDMSKVFEMPTIDKSKVSVSGVEIPRIDLSNFYLSNFDLNAVEDATRAPREAVLSRFAEIVDTFAAAALSAPGFVSSAVEDFRDRAGQATTAVREALPI